MALFPTRDHARLKSMLVKHRQMQSLMEKEIAVLSDDFEFTTENWIHLWVDHAQQVLSECGTTRAFRGISVDEEPMWLVRHRDKIYGYHSLAKDPVTAIEEAQRAWMHRKEVRRNWAQVEEIARDLAAGRLKFDVHVEDAYASPLCTAGIKAFMKRFRISHVKSITGRRAAMLMRADNQVGFVIHEAWKREMSAQPVSVGAPQAVPAE